MNRFLKVIAVAAVVSLPFLLSAGPAPAYAQANENSTASTAPSGFSVFVGGGWTDLAGGTGEGGTLQPGPLGVAIERKIAGPVSLRGELLVRGAGAQLRDRGLFALDGEIYRGEIGLAGLMRAYLARPRGLRFFGALGASRSAQTYCDVNLIGGPGFLGGETIACDEWEEVELRPASTSSSAIGTFGAARGRLELELRYDHGFGVAVASPGGDMRARSLGLILHYRIGTLTG